jgi:hypothetical protein
MVLSRKLLSIAGGQLMLILVPWKPVVFVFGCLVALILFGYYGSALIEGKNPFIPYRSVESHVAPGQPTAHSAAERNHKAIPAKSD